MQGKEEEQCLVSDVWCLVSGLERISAEKVGAGVQMEFSADVQWCNSAVGYCTNFPPAVRVHYCTHALFLKFHHQPGRSRLGQGHAVGPDVQFSVTVSHRQADFLRHRIESVDLQGHITFTEEPSAVFK